MSWENLTVTLGPLGQYSTIVNPYPLQLQPSEDEIKTAITINNRAATRQAIINAVRKSDRNFYERSQWSLKETPNPIDIKGTNPSNPNLEFDWDYQMIAIHHAGESYSCSADFGNIRRVEEKHIENNKWVDIGYHYAIDCSGNIYEARDIRFKGSHLTSYNTGAIGIVLLENLATTGENGVKYRLIDFATQREMQIIPDIQFNALTDFIKIITQYFAITTLGGHREFPKQNRTCPGNMGMITVNILRTILKLNKP